MLSHQKPKAIAVVGSTASGKTALALMLAREFGGEIVSVDSRQLYRGMRIGADIPEGEWKTVSGRRAYHVEGIPHHLMNVLSPAKPITAAEFRDMALRKMRDIVKRGKLPILVGGTMLYMRALTDGITLTEVPPNEEYRKRLEKLSTVRLYGILQRKDPMYAARIPRENRRYAVRALEVMEATGRTFTDVQAERTPVPFDILQLGVSRPVEELNRRIGLRVDDMVAEGLAEEASRLASRYGWEVPSMTGIGHRQFKAYLEGQGTLQKAIEQVKADTRRYAKRQRTWLRRDGRINWVKGYREAKGRVRRFLAK
jgi:tRNA dimethylallyltransferase